MRKGKEEGLNNRINAAMVQLAYPKIYQRIFWNL